MKWQGLCQKLNDTEYWIQILNIEITQILALEKGLRPKLSLHSGNSSKISQQRALTFSLKPASDIAISQSSYSFF